MFLYIRMGIIMVVKLYIARVLLEALGIDDYGIWNVIFSFVLSFQFVSSPIVSSTQRYLNFDMGQGGKQLTKIFNLSFELMVIISILLLIGLETAGRWFVDYKMNFPPEKYGVAKILYQLTIFSLIIQLLQKPFESTIIAHEKMSFYAYISLFESLSLLVITLILKSDIASNKLLWYGGLNLFIILLLFIIYWGYCHKNFICCRLRLIWEKKLAREILVFSGWNLFGGLSSMTANQGVNLLINVFFGVAVNAAFGIATQVRGAIQQIITNSHKAFNPQIVKNYSSGDTKRLHFLVTTIIRLSYILALAMIFPLSYNFDYILKIWLGPNIPTYTYWFSILTLIQMLFIALGGPIDVAIFSTGKIKAYQLWLSGEIFLNVIIIYILFKLNYSPIWAFIIKVAVEILIVATRFVFLKRIGIGFRKVLRNIILPLTAVTLITCGGSYILFYLLSLSEGFLKLLSTTFIYLTFLFVTSWFTILNQHTRKVIMGKVKGYIHL